MEFMPMTKIARYSRQVIVTEKIDGTNASVLVGDDGSVMAGSRTRWITPEDDNFGFAAWVRDNEEQLRHLGPGHHFGEWWGRGIQRNYGLTGRRFSLFNVRRWLNDDGCIKAPECCDVVPVLWCGDMDRLDVTAIMCDLAGAGSRAEAGFMKPEGIVIFHTAAGHLFKKTFEKDAEGKGK